MGINTSRICREEIGSLAPLASQEKKEKKQTPRSIIKRLARVHHSILIFMSPSFVSTIPWSPILLGPSVGVTIMPPPLFDLSLVDGPLIATSLPAFVAVPHKLLSRCAGDCEMMGLLCTLTPGDTARRLIDASSKSSSRRRLLDFLSASAAVGGFIGPGVDARDVQPVFPPKSMGVAPMVGESKLMSSLIAEEPARANLGGGGVCATRWLTQLPLLAELRPVFRLPDAPNSPLVVDASRLMPLSFPSPSTPSSGPSRP